MSRLGSAAFVFLLLWIPGCAGLPVDAALLGRLVGQHLSVSVPSEIPLPENLTLDLGPGASGAVQLSNQFFSALRGESLERRLGRTLKAAASPLSRETAAAFRKQLVDAALFGSVLQSGANVEIALGISRWGLAYNSASKSFEPVLDLEASLSAPGLGVVWKASRSARDLGAPILSSLRGLDPASLLSGPEGFQQAMGVAAADLSRQLVDELRKSSPHR